MSVIRTLLCHSHVPMALRCLASLRRCHQPPFRLLIHDDGTLTDEDCARLADTLPGTTFIRRAEADGPVLAALEKYPACRQYRAQHAMALKLFDVPLLSGETRLVYTDADVYYLRPFTGYHRLWENPDARFIFPQDIETVYSIRYFHLYGARRIPLIARLNAGIMLVDPAAVDLAFLEWVLTRLDLSVLPNLIEQTCWAAQAARTGPCLFLSPRQVNYPLLKRGQAAGRASIPSERVALHFVTFLRDRLAWLDDAENTDAAPPPTPVVLKTVPTRRLSAPEYALHRGLKQLRYWQAKFA